MQQKIVLIFLANLLLFSALYVLFIRKLFIPPTIKKLLLLGFIVSPAYLPIKGVESLLYAQDIIGPLLIFGAFRKRKASTAKIANLRFFLFLFLIAWPIFTTTMVFAIGNDGGFQFDTRGFLGLGIWLYRNLILFSIFVLASSANIEIRQFKDILIAFSIFSLGLLFFAAINYTNTYDLAVYEQVLAVFNWDDSFNYTNKSPFGWGFLGMFRGSMGQWYANSALLAMGAFITLSGTQKYVALAVAAASAALVFISYSRAGMVALILSVIIYTILLGMRGWRLVLIATLCSIAVFPFLKVNTLQERVESISTYTSSKEVNRLDGWRLSLNHFSENPVDFLVGVGATNRQKVANSIGAFGAHDEYIDSIFRAGIGGLIFLLIILVKLTLHSLQLYRRGNRPLEKAILAIAPTLFVTNAVIGITQDHLFRSFSSYVTGPMLYILYGVMSSLIIHKKIRHQTIPQLHSLYSESSALLIKEPQI